MHDWFLVVLMLVPLSLHITGVISHIWVRLAWLTHISHGLESRDIVFDFVSMIIIIIILCFIVCFDYHLPDLVPIYAVWVCGVVSEMDVFGCFINSLMVYESGSLARSFICSIIFNMQEVFIFI